MLFQCYESIGHFSLQPQRATVTNDGDKVMSVSARFYPTQLWLGGPTIIDTDNLRADQVMELERIWPNEDVKKKLEKWLSGQTRRFYKIEKMPEKKVTVNITSGELAKLRAGDTDVDYSVMDEPQPPPGVASIHHGPRTVGKKKA